MKALFFRFIFLFVLITFISACSFFEVKVSEPQNPLWQNHKNNVLTIQHWKTQGRFAAKGDEESWNGHFKWLNDSGEYSILISAPLSGGSFQIKGNKQKAILILDNDQTYSDTDANSLIHKYTGLKLPINQLHYWMLGIPSTNQPINLINLDDQGKLSKLKQDGWEISFKRYTDLDNKSLPNKIFIENHEFDVRLILQNWVVR